MRTHTSDVSQYGSILIFTQMPIVDGLSSTKLIRSFEKTHPSHRLSTRAALNGRVPIIAVSASLIEKERQVYIDAGFDGWILKPINFARLSEIMTGIVNTNTRKANLYRAGSWESGGWFEGAKKDAFASDTKPSKQPPMIAPGASVPSEGVKNAAAANDPFWKEEDESVQSREQKRLEFDVPSTQKAASMPELGSGKRDADSSEETITAARPTASPRPMSPAAEGS